MTSSLYDVILYDVTLTMKSATKWVADGERETLLGSGVFQGSFSTFFVVVFHVLLVVGLSVDSS